MDTNGNFTAQDYPALAQAVQGASASPSVPDYSQIFANPNAGGTYQAPSSTSQASQLAQQPQGMYGSLTPAQTSLNQNDYNTLMSGVNNGSVSMTPAEQVYQHNLYSSLVPDKPANNTFADLVAGGVLAGTGLGAAGAFDGLGAAADAGGALGDAAGAVPDTGALLNTGDLGAVGGAADASGGTGLSAGEQALLGAAGAGGTSGALSPGESALLAAADQSANAVPASVESGLFSGATQAAQNSAPNLFQRLFGSGSGGSGQNNGNSGGGNNGRSNNGGGLGQSGQGNNSQNSNLPPALQAITGALQVAQGIKGLPGMTTQAQIQKNSANTAAANQALSQQIQAGLMAAALKGSSMPSQKGTNPGLNFSSFAKGGSVVPVPGAPSSMPAMPGSMIPPTLKMAMANSHMRHMAAGGATSGGAMGAIGGAGGGQADDVPAKLSSGEYVIPADVVSHLGSGNNQAGSSALDTLVQNARTHRASHGTKLPPKAKNPQQYMGS